MAEPFDFAAALRALHASNTDDPTGSTRSVPRTITNVVGVVDQAARAARLRKCAVVVNPYTCQRIGEIPLEDLEIRSA